MKKKNAFTLAEILITLVIIGVVAAITIPTLMNSTGDKEYVAASKRVLATVAEAGRQMAIEDDIKRYKNVTDFVENGLSKRIDINKYCAPTGSGSTQTTGVPTDCGFAQKYMSAEGSIRPIDFSNTYFHVYGLGMLQNYSYSWGGDYKAYSFQMSNGYSIMVFYNRKCINPPEKWKTKGLGSASNSSADYACMSGLYDMNGKKGPNQMGKDMGAFAVFNPGMASVATSVLPVIGATKEYTLSKAQEYCRSLGSDVYLPDVEELSTLALFQSLIKTSDWWTWTGSDAPASSGWLVYFYGTPHRTTVPASYTYQVRCIRK